MKEAEKKYERGSRMLLLRCVCLLTGAVIGSYLPDTDQWLFFLVGQHRSILTHSPLIPLALYVVAQRRGELARWFSAGVAAAFATHFVSDLFPAGWYGFATISIPLLGRLNGTLSAVWIACSAIACGYLAILPIQQWKIVRMRRQH